ncbi:CNDH2_C domain-containing protein [Trichonephila clavipes]|nr:CNDH2_C domain-containing protein [Trichonephila clavipes]
MPGLLRESSSREPFEVEVYASRILTYFSDTNKNVISFGEFCEGKEHWETCRYFFASLHLAATDKVTISTIRKDDGTDLLLLTLLTKD